MNLSDDDLSRLFAIDAGEWLEETNRNAAFLARFGEGLPRSLLAEHRRLVERLEAARN